MRRHLNNMSPQEKPKTELDASGKLRSLVQSTNFKSAVAAALPAHLRPDRFVRIALTALTKTPRLAECEQASFFECLLTLSQLGLEPDGRLAHLIPFRNNRRGVTECTLIVDYKGLVALAIRSGRIANIHADKICNEDEFLFDRGEIVRHRIDFKKPRGDAYAYYALVRFKDGTEQAEVMTMDEIESIRRRSRAANDGPWVTDFNEMAKKTVFRRLTKWLELSPEYRDALEADSDALEEKQFEAALPIERPVFDALPSPEKQEEETRLPERRPPPAAKQQKAKAEPPMRAGVVIGGKAQEIKKEEFPEARKGSKTPYTDEVMRRLRETATHDSDLLAVAREYEWVDKGTTFVANVGEDKAKALLDNWGLITEKMDDRRRAIEREQRQAAEQTTFSTTESSPTPGNPFL